MMGVVCQVVEGQAVGAEPEVALRHALLQQLLHAGEFRVGRVAADAVLQAHHLHTQHGVRNKRADVGAERHSVEMIQVIAGVVPLNRLDTFVQHRLGNVLHAREAIDDGVLLAALLPPEAGAEAAVAHQHRGGAVPDHLGQAGLQVDFEIEVGVDIEQAGHQPLAFGFDDVRRFMRRQCAAAGGDAPGAKGDIFLPGRCAGAVEDQRVADQRVPGCHCFYLYRDEPCIKPLPADVVNLLHPFEFILCAMYEPAHGGALFGAAGEACSGRSYLAHASPEWGNIKTKPLAIVRAGLAPGITA